MAEIYKFFEQYNQVFYFLLGLAAIYYGWNLYLAIVEIRSAVFGLEQTSAKRRFNQAAVSLFIVFLMGYLVFATVSFLGPWLSPNLQIPIEVELTQTALENNPELAETPENQLAIDNGLSTAAPLPTVDLSSDGCIPGEIEITFPRPNTIVTGVISVTGIVNVENFGHYKFEIARADKALWNPQMASDEMKIENSDLFAEWDTSRIQPGDYVIQIVVVLVDNTHLEPCRVPIRISGN